jgi:hypothetical protein
VAKLSFLFFIKLVVFWFTGKSQSETAALPQGEILAKFFQQQQQQYIETMYKKHAGAEETGLLSNQFRSALEDCGVKLSSEEREVAFKCADLDESGGLSLAEFRTAVKTPTRLEQWAGALPLARLLAHCLALRANDLEDPVGELSELSDAGLDEAVGVFSAGVRRILADAQAQLRKGLAAMREQAAESAGGHSKFQTFAMSSGKVENFHNGLTERTGETPPPPPSYQE